MERNRKILSEVHHSRINSLIFIQHFLVENNVKDKIVIELSAGSGFVANLWKKAGAIVKAYDKYPEFSSEQNAIDCKPIELNAKLPIASNGADYVLLMETIDHIPDQFLLISEISRILKPGGKLILTKPNSSNFSGRLAHFWLESERSNMFLPNENTVICHEKGKEYLGRIFLIGVQKLRTLTALSGLKIEKIYSNQLSFSSLIWAIILGIPFLLRTYFTYFKLSKKIGIQEKQALKSQLLVNNNPIVLMHKHLCLLLTKTD